MGRPVRCGAYKKIGFGDLADGCYESGAGGKDWLDSGMEA
jgi:hypothetical protein